jgi:hypothetical protein
MPKKTLTFAPSAGRVSVVTLPPVVVSTTPQSGDVAVDPALSEIRVTFSKEMKDLSWSWVAVTSGSAPEFTNKARYLPDRRTCVAGVKLEPGRAYAIAFNTDKSHGFQDTHGNPAMPYLLVFETRAH